MKFREPRPDDTPVFKDKQSRGSGDIPVATSFSRWNRLQNIYKCRQARQISFVPTALIRAIKVVHRLKPAATGLSPLMRLGAVELPSIRGFIAVLLILLMSSSTFAEQFQGTVKFGGVFVPGVVVK